MAEGALQKYKFLRFDGSKRFMAGVDTQNNAFEDNLQEVEKAVQDLQRWHDYELTADEAYDAADQVEMINQLGFISSTRLSATIPDRPVRVSRGRDKNAVLSHASTKFSEEGPDSAVAYLVDEFNADEEEVRQAIEVRERYQEVEDRVHELQEEFRENYGNPASVEENQLPDEEPGTLGFKRWIQKRGLWPEDERELEGTFLETPLYEENSTQLY